MRVLTIYGKIYKITNLINNKCYIGQTKRSLIERFNGHIKKNTTAISLAIKKYGRENFKIEEIDIAYSKDQLDLLEGVYISWFNSLCPNGYNITNIIKTRNIISESTRYKLRSNLFKNYSNFHGVYKSYNNSYESSIKYNNKKIFLGNYENEIDAAKAYDISALKFLGENALLNFPELKKDYLENKILPIKIKNKYNKLRKGKKHNTKIVGVSYHKNKKVYQVRLKNFEHKTFKEEKDANNYALECHRIRGNL